MDSQNGKNLLRLIRISNNDIDKLLITHQKSLSGKVITRAFTVKFSDTREDLVSLTDYMYKSILPFVFSQRQINQIKENKDKEEVPQILALRSFGPISKNSDGKYGELFLFILVEAILKTPMIAHKLSITPRMNQVIGSDCVFYGDYIDKEALLIGEAKVHKNPAEAIDSALESIDKFYNTRNSENVKDDLFIIRKNLTQDLEPEEIEYLNDVLDVTSERYKEVRKVHPIIIVYNESKILEIEKVCKDRKDGEAKCREIFSTLSDDLLLKIIKKLNNEWKSLEPVYLDFFFVPITSIDNLRSLLFNLIHNW